MAFAFGTSIEGRAQVNGWDASDGSAWDREARRFIQATQATLWNQMLDPHGAPPERSAPPPCARTAFPLCGCCSNFGKTILCTSLAERPNCNNVFLLLSL
jgi:hypothetical protein